MLRSKAQVSTEELGDQYCMFGPMKDDRWRLEVEQIEPENRTIRAAIKKFHKDGFRVSSCFVSVVVCCFSAPMAVG